MTTKAIVSEILAEERVDGFVMGDRRFDITVWINGASAKIGYSDFWVLRQAWDENVCFGYECLTRLEQIGLIEVTGGYVMGDGYPCNVTPSGEFVMDVIRLWLDVIPF